jgi:hypothetical protein
MDNEVITRLLDPSPALAIDELERPGVSHAITVRDLRKRFGDDEVYVAECTCGWVGEPRAESAAMRKARRDGTEHIDASSAPYGYARLERSQ